MGYTLQLQWSFTPPPGRQISLADIVLPRVLESYSLHTPARSTIQFRTYRSTSPNPTTTSSNPSNFDVENQNKPISRYLTTINTLPNPLPPGSSGSTNENKEDITYLFLDDRSALIPTSNDGQIPQNSNNIDEGNTQNANRNGNALDQPINIDQPSKIQQDEPIEIDKENIDEDGFEIIDNVTKTKSNDNGSAPGITDQSPANQENNNEVINSNNTTQIQVQPQPKLKNRFKCLVVKPSSNVQPILQSLLSPFVMGYTKSAKAAASTTSSTPIPTPLPGSSLLLTVLTFNSYSYPCPSSSGSTSLKQSQLRLKVFILPNPNANSIFLEVENQDQDQDSTNSHKDGNTDEEVEEICKSFLEGCLVDGLNGNLKWIKLNSEIEIEIGRENWKGIERDKKSIYSLSKALRESGFI